MKICYRGQQVFLKSAESQRKNKTAKRRSKFSQGTRYLPLTNDKGGMVNIKDHAWISSRSTILPRVTVGSGAVLACGAIATKDLEPYGVYAGIPAKKVSDRNNNLKYSLGKNNSFWHFY